MNENQSDDNNSKKSAPTFLGRLTVNEWLTFLVGIGSLAIAALTFINASDTKDIKDAVSNLSALAAQTKRQADGQAEQLRILKGQSATLGGQLEEARKQTNAISEQTFAIKSSSLAAIQSAGAQIKSAQAQKRMADVTAEAQLPSVDLMELRINGLNSLADKDGRIPFTLFWRFHNTGGSAFKAKEVRYGLSFSEEMPEPMPTNMLVVSGADFVITNSITSAFALAEPINLAIDVASRDAVIAGKYKLFFFAVFQYEDGTGASHQKCFGRQILLKDGNGDFSLPAGGSAYHCQT